MDDLAGLYPRNSVQERVEQWTIIFHPVLPNVDDYNAKTQPFEVVFMLETTIYGYQNITMTLGLDNQLGVRKVPPLGFSYGEDIMIRESLTETGVNALV